MLDPQTALEPVHLHTANGNTAVSQTIDTAIRELQMRITPYFLDSTPDVLSIGFRTVKMGYSFLWMAGKRPVLRLPNNGGEIQLMVIQEVPYLAQEIAYGDACESYHLWARQMISKENMPASRNADTAAPASQQEPQMFGMAADDSDDEQIQQWECSDNEG